MLPIAKDRPCRYCHYYDGMQLHAARCMRGGKLYIHSQPAHGCVYWEREPGSDDDIDDLEVKERVK